jgi:septal ring factor EnvC (AmiA/AmiB activator)
MFNRIRRRIDHAVSLRVDPRFEGLKAEFDRRLSAQEERFTRLRADYGHLRTEFDRIAPQVAALEYRFERLSARVGDPTDADAAREQAELEHERARLRLQLAAHYEERIRRLEDGRS